MTTQRQEQRPDQLDTRGRQRRRISRRSLVIITVLLLAVAISVIWILSYLNIIPSFLASIFTIIITVLGAVFTFFQSMHLFIPDDEHESHENPPQARASLSMPSAPTPSPQMPPIIVQMPTTQPLATQPLTSDTTTHRGIVGLPPPTDPRTIQQREHVVREVYSSLAQPNITAIALTGIGGVGKSTLAALIYRYVEEQRHTRTSPFLAQTLWLSIDPAVTFADLAGNLFEALERPLPDLGNLAPQNQAVALFNALNSTDKPRLIILDQFENLLDWNTGHALTDRPGVGECLDIINSQPCVCRILLTSRPRPVGTREYPPTYLQEYAVGGLEMNEGIALLQSQGIKGTETELQYAVSRCDGHAFALTLLATLMRDHHLDLPTLLKNLALWTGDIATNLLDQIYTQRLSDIQRELLLAFAAYREPVPLDAVLAITSKASKGQASSALKALRTQHLLEPVGEGRYQLHTIIAEYAQIHFDESNEQANEEALRTAHARAAQYYLEQAAKNCPPREHRRKSSDVHELIEAIWQLCQAGQWQKAYDVLEGEGISDDLRRWGGNAILLELARLLLSDKWELMHSQLAKVYETLGRVYRALGPIELSRTYFEKALSMYKTDANIVSQARVLNQLGVTYYNQGQKEEASRLQEESLKLYKEAGDLGGIGMILNHLGRAYDSMGQRKQAQEHYQEALSILRNVGDRENEGWTLYSLGRLLNTLGQNEYALRCLEEALNILQEIGDRGKEGWVLNNIGLVHGTMGHNERALQYYEEALKVLKEVGDHRGEGRVLNNLGEAYDKLGQKEQALEYYEKALKMYREVGDHGGEGWTLHNLGLIYAGWNKNIDAQRYFREALIIYKKVSDRMGEGQTLYDVGKFYFEHHHYEISLACLLCARNVLDKIQSPLGNEAQNQIEKMHQALGHEKFTALLVKIESQAQKVVDQALHNELQFSD